MLWLTVWTVLVLVTLTGAFFLLRSVYRSGKALAAELSRASSVASELLDRAEDLSAAAEARARLVPVELTDPGPARARLAVTALATQRRRDARAARHEVAYSRWRSFSR